MMGMRQAIFCFSVFSLLILVGCTSQTSSGSNAKIGQNLPSSSGGVVSCPERSLLQSDWDYCFDLCMLNKGDAGIYSDQCSRMCDQAEYVGGTSGLQKRIQSYRCNKCNDCTDEQLKEKTPPADTAPQQVAVPQQNNNAETQGANLALGKSATASINPETAGGAVDGDLTTYTDDHRYASNIAQYAGAWWQVDLGSEKRVGKIQIYANPGSTWSDFPVKWHIDYSSDGNGWTLLVNETTSQPQVPIQYTFSPVTARYLRLTADQPNADYWWYMQEFLVFEN